MSFLDNIREESHSHSFPIYYFLFEGEEKEEKERKIVKPDKRSRDSKILLEQMKTDDSEYLLLTYPYKTKEQLEDLYFRNKYFITSLITARAKQLQLVNMGYHPLFRLTNYGVQNQVAYVRHEIDKLTKVFEDEKIFLIKDGKQEQEEKKIVNIQSSLSPGISPIKPMEPEKEKKGRGRGGGRGGAILRKK